MVEIKYDTEHYLVMIHNNVKKLGKNIKNRRKALKYSQEKLAELVNKSRNYIGMVERAELNISISSLFELADALQIEPCKLFEFK